MRYKRCPKCELNYILESEELCKSCAENGLVQKAGSLKKRIHRSAPRRNIAFKCNYCDGGKENNGIGFSGICSDDILQYNVSNRVWCGADECYCKQYATGQIGREQLEDLYSKDNRCICYESHLLVNWGMAAGFVVRGKNKGMPNKLLGVTTNSLCILTTRQPNSDSADRYIIGVFLVKRSDEGDDVNAGTVTAEDKYRISLTIEEAKEMPFWKYYQNNSDKAPTQWGTGLFRYVNDEAAIHILKDIVDVKNNIQEKAAAKEFLEHFIAVNNLGEQIL